jgi:hypothetical protein
MQVIESQKARFGQPILLDLGGQGIRGMDTFENTVLIVGGPANDPIKNALGHGSVPPHRLYRWSGIGQTKPQPLAMPDLSALFVEGILSLGNQLMFVSDDGKMLIGEKQCQDLGEQEQRFRGVAAPKSSN